MSPSSDPSLPSAVLPDHPLLAGATLRGAGEAAVVVEFGDAIDPAIQARATALADALIAAAPTGLVEALPTFRSTLVEFDPAATNLDTIWAALPRGTAADAAGERRRWRLPVCVEGEMAEDLDILAADLSLDPQTVRERILASTLTVGMYGFVPGLPYLYGLDETLHVPRRATPRPPVPARSLIIAVGQVCLMPIPMPTGWYVCGRIAMRTFDEAAAGRGEVPVPFGLGDEVTLEPVPASRIEALWDEPMGGAVRS